MFTLLGTGTLTAYLYSLFGLFFLPTRQNTPFFDAAAAITTLILAGQWIEQRSENKLAHSLKNLLSLTPPTARLLQGSVEKMIPWTDIQPGQHLLVLPGENIPTDGKILEGHASVEDSNYAACSRRGIVKKIRETYASTSRHIAGNNVWIT